MMKPYRSGRGGCAAAALLLAILGASSAEAVAPSITPDMPPEIQSWRTLILSKADYERLADEWRAYIDSHPRSAVAHIQLARALRYAGASIDEQNALVRKAFELDPNCPEALDALATSCLNSAKPIVENCTDATQYGLKAVEMAPHWPEPHFTLWANAMALERKAQAREHLRAILAKGGFPPPILDFGYNLMMSAQPEAIIFTNGDNDTYPLLALQVVHDIRPDVLIVNLSLLNRIEYATSIWEDLYGENGPFTKPVVERLYTEWKKDKNREKRFAIHLVRELVRSVQRGAWTKPVYFAITVAEPSLECCEQTFTLEGILWRLEREKARDGKEDEPRIDLPRTLHLFRDVFRMDSATDLAYGWRPESAVRLILLNYPAVLRIAATTSAEAGDLDAARYALREAILMLDFHDSEGKVKAFAEYWKQLDPDNPEVDRWLD